MRGNGVESRRKKKGRRKQRGSHRCSSAMHACKQSKMLPLVKAFLQQMRHRENTRDSIVAFGDRFMRQKIRSSKREGEKAGKERERTVGSGFPASKRARVVESMCVCVCACPSVKMQVEKKNGS